MVRHVTTVEYSGPVNFNRRLTNGVVMATAVINSRSVRK